MSLIDALLGGAVAPTQASTPAPMAGDPVVIQGDNWHPSSPGWLGKALDTLLMMKGRQPVFQQRKAMHDLNSVMPDFNSDPEQTIKRVAQIPGMADDAFRMRQQYENDQEKNESRNLRDAQKMDIVWNRIGAMAGSATEKNYDFTKKLMRDYITRWRLNPDDFDIPETYDRDKLDALSDGAISAKDQAAQALRSKQVDSLTEYRLRRLEQFDTQEAGRNSRFQQREEGVQDRYENPVARPTAQKPAPRPTMTKYGPALISPDGNQMIVTNPKMGGRQYGYIRVGNNWVPVGETAQSKKEHGSDE